MVHSNGLIYVASQGDDRIYRTRTTGVARVTVVWATNLTAINNPTALLEMPDGSTSWPRTARTRSNVFQPRACS